MEYPNIVFVFADQMRASALGCLGKEDAETPNLDRLAAEGTLFTRAISNHPVCCPARATLLTGLHSLRHGLVTNDQQLRTDVPTVAHRLNALGYRCGYVGKWHVDCIDRGAFIPPGPRRRGFDDLWAVNSCNHDYLNAYYYLNDSAEPVWIEGYEPVAQTDIAVDYIRNRSASSGPFCLFLSWGPPHCPYRAAPQAYLDRYPPDRICLKANAASHADRNTIAGYYAHITALDDCFGRILRTLDGCGIAGNTVVVFTSDHGDMLYSQDHGWKMKPWSESVNIPFVVRWPGRVPAGRRCGAPVGLVDVMPTLLGLAGAGSAGEVDGKDLSALFLGNASNPPRSQFIYNIVGYEGWSDGYGEWRGVVTESHTYARLRDRAWLLYNDGDDPCQLRNLVDDPASAGTRNHLEGELQKWLAATDDPFCSSAEAVSRYVDGKVVVSEDRDTLIPQLIDAYALRHPSAPELAAEAPFRPGRDRIVRYFENAAIAEGKGGAGRKRFHCDLFAQKDA